MSDLVALLVAGLVARTDNHWREAAGTHRPRLTWEPMKAAAGGAIAGLKLASGAINGAIPVGTKLDPETRAQTGSLLLPTRNSWVIIGRPDSGKTSRGIAPGIAWELANGNNVVL